MHKILMPVFLLFANFLLAQQQQGGCHITLQGKVLDEHNKEFLPYATILIKNRGLAVVSDSLGMFSFQNLCAGSCVLVAKHIDCEDVTITFNLSVDTVIAIYQEHHTKELQQLVISSQRSTVQQSLNLATIGRREMESNAGKALGEMLKEVSGVSSLQTGNNISKPVIHGLHSNRVLILNNGVRQEGQQWGNEHGPEIDPFVADKVTVLKGAAGVRYGPDAIGGVVILEPAMLRDSAGYDGVIHMAGASNGRQGTVSGLINGNIKALNGLNFRLQGTLKKAGNAHTPDYYLKNTGFNEKNFSAALAYQKNNYGSEVFYSRFNSTIGIFSAAHIGNLTDLQRAFRSSVPLDTAGFSYEINRPYQQIIHDLFKWKSYINLNKAGKLTYTFSRQQDNRAEYDKHRPRNDSVAALNKPELTFIIHTLMHEVVYDLQHHRKFNLQAGAVSMHQANSYEGRYFIPNFINRGWGSFITENYKHRHFFAEAGIRYDERKLRVFLEQNGFITQPYFRYSSLSGLIGTGFNFEKFDVKLNFGSGWRAPSANELYANGVHHGAAAVEIGDENLTRENNINTALWLGIKPQKKLSGEIEVYQNHIQNFIYLLPVQPATLTIRGAFPTFRYTQINAVLRGADVQLKYSINNNLQLTVRGNYLYAINADDQTRLTQMPQNMIEPTLTWEPKLRSNKISDLFFKVSYQMFDRAPLLGNDEDYVMPPPGYRLLNVNAGFKFKLHRQFCTAGISINNALNTRYRNYLNRYRYFADELGTNVLLYLKIPIHFKS
jgi:iron complex outermembrane receptor protein